MRARWIALLISHLPKSISQYYPYRILCMSLPSMLSAYDNAEVEQPILFISPMQRYSANAITLKSFHRKHYDTLHIYTHRTSPDLLSGVLPRSVTRCLQSVSYATSLPHLVRNSLNSPKLCLSLDSVTNCHRLLLRKCNYPTSRWYIIDYCWDENKKKLAKLRLFNGFAGYHNCGLLIILTPLITGTHAISRSKFKLLLVFYELSKK